MHLKRNFYSGGVIFLLFVIVTNAFGNTDTLPVKKRKHYFSLEVGGHRSLIFGNRYYKPNYYIDPKYNHDISTPPQYEFFGFYDISVTGWQSNFLFAYSVKENCMFQTGLSIFNSHVLMESDGITQAQLRIMDSVYNINNNNNYYYCYNCTIDRSIIKYKFSPINFDLPIYIGFVKNRIEIVGGLKFNLISIKKEYRVHTNGRKESYKYLHLDNPLKHQSMYDYGTFQIANVDLKLFYLINSKYLKFKPFVGILMTQPFNRYFFQGGINIPFTKL